MFPLKATFVSCDDELIPVLRRELINNGAEYDPEFRTVSDAIANLHLEEDERRLIIFHLRDQGDIQQLARLCSMFSRCPTLVLVAENEARSVIPAMRAGAAQVVMLPLLPEDFKSAVERIGAQFGYQDTAGRVIAITGATGGCGATTIAVNLAAEIAHLYDLPTLLVDLSLQMGMVATYLDLAPRYTSYDLLADIDQMDTLTLAKVIMRVGPNFDVLPGPHHAIEKLQVDPTTIHRLVEFTRRVAKVVVLDVPCTYDDAFFATLSAANHVVIIGQQNLPSIRNLKMLRDTISQEGGDERVRMVINRYHPKMEGFVQADLESILLQRRADHASRDGLFYVANDHRTVNSAINRGVLLRKENPESKVLADIDRIVERLLNIENTPSTNHKKASLFRGIIRAFGLT